MSLMMMPLMMMLMIWEYQRWICIFYMLLWGCLLYTYMMHRVNFRTLVTCDTIFLVIIFFQYSLQKTFITVFGFNTAMDTFLFFVHPHSPYFKVSKNKPFRFSPFRYFFLNKKKKRNISPLASHVTGHQKSLAGLSLNVPDVRWWHCSYFVCLNLPPKIHYHNYFLSLHLWNYNLFALNHWI